MHLGDSLTIICSSILHQLIDASFGVQVKDSVGSLKSIRKGVTERDKWASARERVGAGEKGDGEARHDATLPRVPNPRRATA